MSSDKYFGIYRGMVENNDDPTRRGRIRVLVPDVESTSLWAHPCFPLVGNNMGFFFVPPINSFVWIEFEQGDKNCPIWVGGSFRGGELPGSAYQLSQSIPNIVLQSAEQHSIVISDLSGPTGGIMLKSKTGASIIVNDTGIYIENGKGARLTMVGTTVDINNGSLTI